MLERISGDERINPADMVDAPVLALGLDYGGGFDLASLVVVADDPDTGMVAVQRSWICQDGYDRIAAADPHAVVARIRQRPGAGGRIRRTEHRRVVRDSDG